MGRRCVRFKVGWQSADAEVAAIDANFQLSSAVSKIIATVHCCACWGARSCPADISHSPTCRSPSCEAHHRVATSRTSIRVGPVKVFLSMTFDCSLPAEMYLAKRGGGERQQRQYRRFPTAAATIRFAVEDFPPVRTLNAWIQVGDECFDSSGIQRLYECRGYPGAAEHLEVQPPSE